MEAMMRMNGPSGPERMRLIAMFQRGRRSRTFFTGVRDAVAGERHVVGHGDRSARSGGPGEVLLRVARLADRSRGAGYDDPGPARGVDLHRLPAGRGLSTAG